MASVPVRVGVCVTMGVLVRYAGVQVGGSVMMDAGVQVGGDVMVGAGVFVGRGVQVGGRVTPGAGVLVGCGVQVGGNVIAGVGSGVGIVPVRVIVGVIEGVQVSSGVFVGRGVHVGAWVGGTSVGRGVQVGSGVESLVGICLMPTVGIAVGGGSGDSHPLSMTHQMPTMAMQATANNPAHRPKDGPGRCPLAC